MKYWMLVAGLALCAAGCAPVPQGSVVMECSEYIGKPITKGIAAYGYPKSVTRLSPTEVGYVFKVKETTVVGGEVFYTPNYMVGVDVQRMPSYLATSTCTGIFVARAPYDGMPLRERIVIGVRPY